VTGEDYRWSVRSSVQPGGRVPAPGELALVQAFINTHYDLEFTHGADLLATPKALSKWLRAHDLLRAPARLDDRDVARAVAAREGLRALARGSAATARAAAPGTRRSVDREQLERLNVAASGAAAEVRFTPTGPQLALAHDGGIAAAIGVLLALTAQAMFGGSWWRLKICPGEDCGWAFYDHSRNQTGRWCSMAVCGGRAKARTHYARRRGST
jgi:predicted RNA-binding Zn ribbon-like protein